LSVFEAFADRATVNHEIVLVRAPIDVEGAEGEFVEVHTRLLGESLQALFLEVMAEKADQLCSTSLLPQSGQMTSPCSYSASVSTFENVLLQAWQKNS
jgi:hypothetical protein